MNKQKLSQMRCKRVRVRPVARRVDPNGMELPQIDDVWLLTQTSKGELELGNPRTAHTLRVGTDHVREYLTDNGGADGFLMLKSQIFLYARGLAVEPLGPG